MHFSQQLADQYQRNRLPSSHVHLIQLICANFSVTPLIFGDGEVTEALWGLANGSESRCGQQIEHCDSVFAPHALTHAGSCNVDFLCSEKHKAGIY